MTVIFHIGDLVRYQDKSYRILQRDTARNRGSALPTYPNEDLTSHLLLSRISESKDSSRE
jgi:hypothetical protein